MVVLGGSLVHAASGWSIVSRIGPDQRPALLDSIIYEYIGWYLSEGARLYVDIWEVKPPLVYELTGVVAVMTGDRMVLYHWLLVVLTMGISVLAAVVIGQLTLRLTDNPTSAAIAGLAPFTYPMFGWRPAVGFKPKYFVILFGLLTVYAALTDRPTFSGAFGAASMGTWQLSVVFPAVAVGMLYRRRSPRRLGRFVVGFALLTLIMFLPIVLWGSMSEMVVETILIPLIAGRGTPLSDRLDLAMGMLGIPSVILIVGIIGIIRLVREDPGERWWLGVVAGWLLFQVLILDLDSAPDLLPLFAISAIGVGAAVHEDAAGGRVVALVPAFVVLSVLSIVYTGMATGYSWLPPAIPTPVDTTTMPAVPYTGREVRMLFWRPLPSETCRAFYGGMQSRYLFTVGAPYGTECGAWSPAWDWIRTHWLP